MWCVFQMSLREHQRLCRTSLWPLSQSTPALAPSSRVSAKSYLWALLSSASKTGVHFALSWKGLSTVVTLHWLSQDINEVFCNKQENVLSHLKVDTAEGKKSSQWQSLISDGGGQLCRCWSVILKLYGQAGLVVELGSSQHRGRWHQETGKKSWNPGRKQT